MTDAARLVGLDVGTSSTKGVLVEAGSGRVLASAERSYSLSTPRPGWAEQDPQDWWGAASAVLDELGDADAIGLSGQMHGLVALDADDRVLRPAILWNDGRSQPQCDMLIEELGLSRLVALSGNRPLAGFTAPKLRWMAENEPELFGRIRRVLLPKDYVRLRLCGEAATDVSDASGTLLLDVGARAWSAELCAALGVDEAWLPPVLESGAVSGLTADGVPVAAGAGDQAAGALGVGVLREGGAASVVLGTSGVVFAARDRFAPDAEGRLHAFCHAAPDTWHVMGVMLSAAGGAALAARRDRSGRRVRRPGRRGGRRGRPASRACCSPPTWPASARPIPTPTRAAPSSACRCATTAAPWFAPCSRASPSACATRWT